MNYRNFVIIAHVDHGKSTLADRMLELTQTVSDREMKDQLLDQMDLERERGITIKLQPVRMRYGDYILNLIDTPGHVDFSYEVSRSLAAVEGAILLVDASQGVQAQTLSTLYQAIDQNLAIIPVINKIDLPHAEPERRAQELVKLLGCPPDDIIFASGKTGAGVKEILNRVIQIVPAPAGNQDKPLRALVFDCIFDAYRGVVAYVRIVDGNLDDQVAIRLIQGKKETESLEVGYFRPGRERSESLRTGEIGYIVTGLKEVSDIGIGDTVTVAGKLHPEPLPGYRVVTPMVFASLYAIDSDQYPALRDAIGKLKLNDASLQYVPEHSPALGFGFRCGFLGMLHLEIVIERLQREYGIEVIATVPSVAYQITTTDGQAVEVQNPAELPDITRITGMSEPWVKLEVVTPQSYLGAIMDLSVGHRGAYQHTQFLDEDRVLLSFEIPLSEIVVSYYDELKSISSGYASMSYDLIGYRSADLVKIDILVAGNPVDALSTIVPRTASVSIGRTMVEKLKELIPKHNFEVAIQAAIGGKVIARETISAFRKDVTAKLYGGDVTRKNKLLEKQKKGKKKMKRFGNVDIPSNVFIDLMKR
ncbi:translation elongation factor 4 [Patescibacteria group bacterium]|nr:translation elongation factor 4 [Patescibacteria group bacterium]